MQWCPKLLEFGFPIELNSQLPVSNPCRNHKGVLDYSSSSSIDKYVEKELKYGSVLGPFKTPPFRSPAIYSPLSTVDKNDSPERRVIMDLSFLLGHSINDHINTSEYLGTPVRLRYPKVDDLIE